jgi:hypothetical protein
MRLDTGIWYEVEVAYEWDTSEWFTYENEGVSRLSRPEADRVASIFRREGRDVRVIRVTHSREILL